MGLKGIRTALKVDLNKPAREQPGLHVRLYLPFVVAHCSFLDRIDGIRKACHVIIMCTTAY
jgi:hypothetical protein